MSSDRRYSPQVPAPELPGQQQPQPAVVASPARRVAGLLILAGLLIFLFWFALKSWRVYQAAQSLMAVQVEAQTLLSEGVDKADPDAVEALILGARSNIMTLRDELGFIRPFASYLGWVPRLGPSLVASPFLIDMADAGSEAGALAISNLKPALAIVQSEDFGMTDIGELLPILAEAAPALDSAAGAIQRYEAAREELAAAVGEDELPWRVQQLLMTSDELIPAAESGLVLAPYLPELLGNEGARRYLIMAQNEDEMRGTGGFLTGVGLLTVENGQVTGLTFGDANQVDNWREKPYAFPPQPFYDFMGLELFLFRDANYWPDFPTSAQKALELYAYGQNIPLPDGAIAIDQEFLRILVDATGPVPIPGTDQSISADNVLEALRQARDIQEGQEVREWVHDRKAFLGGFAAAILSKLEMDFSSIEPIKLVRNLSTAAEERHLSIYMRDPDLAAALAEIGWDGHIPAAPPGDLWMVVDTNMGYNKANIYVDRSFHYNVSLNRQPEATLTIQYNHTGPAGDEPCYQGVEEEFELATDYLSLADQCYWNYLRVFAPAGSTLIGSSQHLVPGDTLFLGETWDSTGQTVDDLPWLATFANFMLLPRGGKETAYFHYLLPKEVVQNDGGDTIYHLTVQKQPGTRAESLRMTITLPEGVSLQEAVPKPSSVVGNQLSYELELITDVDIAIRYQ